MAFRSLSSFIPTADELLALDLPRLGRILLLHLKSYEGLNTVFQNGRLNRDYFVAMLENRNVGLGPPPHREPEYGAKQSEVVRALTEAWNWLEREGLLIRDAEQPAAWFAISRRGEELLKNAGRFEQWERLGLERVKNDLMTGGTRVIGGTLEVQDLAWQWVRMKEGQATTPMDKTAATKSVHVDDLLARRRYVGADVAATSGTENAKMANESKTPGDKSRRVFVIHGRDERLRAGIFTFLRALGLEPIEWVKAIQLTGNASPYIGEILEAAFNHAQAAVVLLSPDDEARLRSDLLRPNDPPSEKELTGQARPNVLFEAGMAFASHPKQTVLVQFGEVRPFSDVAGRHIVRMDNSVGKRQEFAVKLRTAGCSVDTEGTDWHTSGDLAPAIENNGTIRDIYVNVETYDRVQLEPTSPPQRVSNIVSLRPLPASRRAIADDSDTWREVSDENGFLSAIAVFRNEPLKGVSLRPIDGLTAQITFFEPKGGEVLRVHHGTWLGDPFNHTELAVGDTRELLIAVDHPGAPSAFAIENSRGRAVDYEHEGSRERPLARRLYDVTVRLIGSAVSEGDVADEFHFNLDLRGDAPILKLEWTR